MCFYLTFATFLGYFLGRLLNLEVSDFVVTLPILVGTAFFSAYLDERRWIKYLSFLPLVLIFLIIPVSTLNLLILLPLMVYMSWSMSEPLWGQKASGEYVFLFDHRPIFRRFMQFFIVTLFLFLTISFLVGNTTSYPIGFLLFGLTFILASAIFMRMIRHDEDIFAQFRFKIVNAIPIIAVIVVAILFGGDFFSFIWDRIITPIVQMFDPSFVLEQARGGGRFINIGGLPNQDVGTGYADQYLELEGVEIGLFIRVLYLIIFYFLPSIVGSPIWLLPLTMTVVLFWIIRAFWPSKKLRWKPSLRNDGIEEEYFALDEPDTKKKHRRRKENQIREIYRDFLILIKEKEIEVLQHFTSSEIERQVAKNFQSEKSSELRMKYIQFRYRAIEPTKSDIKRMRELYKNVKEEIEGFS